MSSHSITIQPHILFFACAMLIAWPFQKAIAQHNPVTVVYDITVKKDNSSTGIEETYNGGTKTVFSAHQKARIRLTSLMRVQSIFFDLDTALKRVTVIKESGKGKYLFNLTPAQWEQYNIKYSNLSCDTSSRDSLEIKGYACRKAVINLEDEKQIVVYYTDSIKIHNQVIEPLFRCINGLVLQYEIANNNGSIRFSAAEISRTEIDPKIFTSPSKGFIVKKYSPKKKPEQGMDISDTTE